MPYTKTNPIDISNRLYGSFALMLGLLLLLVTFSYLNFQRLVAADRINVHTYQVLLESHRVAESLTNTDAGLRGFIVSGDKGSLQGYRAGLRQFEQHFRTMQRLTSDRQTQQVRLQKLRRQRDLWLSREVKPLIAARRRARTNPEGVLLAARSAPARRARLLAMQSIINAMETTEGNLLKIRSSEQQIFQERTGWTLLIGGLFSVGLALSLSVLIARNARTLTHNTVRMAAEVTERRRTEARLSELVGQLEAANTQLANGNNELARLNGEFERANAELQRSNAELEQFAYVASHDLQEPLRAVGGCVQVLQRRYAHQLDARADELIRHAVDGATRMQNLIHDLLSFSRIGTHGKAFEPVDMEAVLQRVRSNVAVALQESGAQLTQDALPTVRGDRGQLEQVMQNLLSNALKFRDQQAPAIHIGAVRSETDDGWIFSVRDNGPGIEPKYFERIFIMFQRLHTRADYPGTGIGLAICKKIIERHGGRIRVESAPECGSTFFFSIPDTLPEPAAAESTVFEAEVANSATNGQVESNGASGHKAAASALETPAEIHS